MIILSRDPFKKQAAKVFLEHFGQEQKSHVANLFLEAIRNGCNAPDEIVDYVLKKATRRLHKAYSVKDIRKMSAIIQNIYDYPKEAANFARYVLSWEKLPQDIKRQIKQNRTDHYRREYMAYQPPTEKQLKLLRKLRYAGEVSNKLRASQLIGELLNK